MIPNLVSYKLLIQRVGVELSEEEIEEESNFEEGMIKIEDIWGALKYHNELSNK